MSENRRGLKGLLLTAVVVVALAVYLLFWRFGTLPYADPQRCARHLAGRLGGWAADDLTVSDQPSILSPVESFPISVISEQETVVFFADNGRKRGFIHIQLHNPHGLGWKLLEYRDATAPVVQADSQERQEP